MKSRLIASVAGLLLFARAGVAQEHPVRRVANIVSVAVEEYAKGIDERGRLTSAQEYQEAAEFLADARAQALRLSGDRAAQARAILDTIIAAVASRQPPNQLKILEQRFAAALGSEAALELPRKAVDIAEGRAVFERACASCHGVAGRGNGPAARAMNPHPPAIGDAFVMRDVSPATMYRITSVGIAGTPMVGYAGALTPEQRWNIVMYLTSLRTTAQQLAEGEGLYTQQCVQCHGALGAGDGQYARTLSRLPQEIGSFAWQASHSDDQLATVIRAGVPGTAMPPGHALDSAQVRSVVAYLRTLPTKTIPNGATTIAERRRDAAAASRDVLSLLEQSLAASRNGRMSDAADRAFDAYIAFEPLENPARARNPGLVAAMERMFADFKGAARAGDVRAAERARDAIEANMPRILELTRPTGSGFEAFWQSLLIILREGFEAILVIGAIVAFVGAALALWLVREREIERERPAPVPTPQEALEPSAA